MAAFSSGVQVRRFLLMCIVYLIFWILCPTICGHYTESVTARFKFYFITQL